MKPIITRQQLESKKIWQRHKRLKINFETTTGFRSRGRLYNVSNFHSVGIYVIGLKFEEVANTLFVISNICMFVFQIYMLYKAQVRPAWQEDKTAIDIQSQMQWMRHSLCVQRVRVNKRLFWPKIFWKLEVFLIHALYIHIIKAICCSYQGCIQTYKRLFWLKIFWKLEVS